MGVQDAEKSPQATGNVEDRHGPVLGDWSQLYLDSAKARFAGKTYDEKFALFKRFFEKVDLRPLSSN